MGGFRFNGCGATDHFKKVKSLGMHECPKCHQQTEFLLEIAKFKVDVLFIPTLTLKTRYAVMCSKCENGQFVSDAWAAKLMNDGPHEVIFEGVQPAVTQDKETRTVTAAETNRTAALEEGNGVHINRESAAAPSFFKCPYCGVTQMRDGNFCAYCGKPAPEADGGKAVTACPACGAQVKPGAVFCNQCGKKLI